MIRQLADRALEASVVGGFSRIGYSGRRALFDWSHDAASAADLTGKVMVVTGATSGLGAETAHAMAVRGARVWLVGRDGERAERVRDAILAQVPTAQVKVHLADLADLAAAAGLVEAVLAAETRLDVLVHNAGALVHDERRTPQGLELTASVHVVSPFLITSGLLPLLRATAGSRVITVASGGMYTARLDLAALDAPPAPFDGVRAYANAKRAAVVLNEDWAQRPQAAWVTFAAMHPGWVATPGLVASLPEFARLTRPLLRTSAQGADTICWLAATPALLPNGRFWCDRAERPTHKLKRTRTGPAEAAALRAWVAGVAGEWVALAEPAGAVRASEAKS
jgi:NAD(P)-dependent dehydrogenase (short-subunit alcohol dehydrogenase family)